MILDDIKKYFLQYRELYGDEIVIKPEFLKEVFLSKSELLHNFYNEIKDCTKCSLGLTRTNFVFGTGSPEAKMMLIGEAPGREEDLQGEPFVGRAGQLLNRILKAINLEREEVYIANILKCRPPYNRDPDKKEIEMCFPYLLRQIDIINPKIILILGRVAAHVLLDSSDSMALLRGKIHYYKNSKVIVTYHPAALLRNPNLKRPTWEDVQLARKIYDE
ncbi:uracil-DNA glycosylase [candidate division KSB1 bacterium]|nr:MAG: uracil-DNA glycosylase [candidate division KSB1 bacterium]